MTKSLTDKVEALFAEWNRPDSPGCVLGVIKDGRLIYQGAYGMADLERRVPLSIASGFDIGSTGKQFTAMMIAILARQGLLALDDRLQQHLPEMPLYDRPVTIRHLLHHTSGVRDYTALMELAGLPAENFYHEDELLALILRQKELNFNPGDEYLYSNSGYFLLGVIAQRLTGTSLPELIRAYILQPLEMQATDFNDDIRRIIPNRAIGYSPRADGGYATDISFCGGYGDGPIISTVADLWRWDQNFYDNKLGGGGPALIEQMLTPGRLNSGEPLGYAFGLELGHYRGLQTVSHGGAWAGYRAELLRFPEQKFAVICLANLGSIAPWRLARQVADLYLADLFPEPARAAAKFVELPNGQIERLSGFYRSQKSGTLLELAAQAGKLVGEEAGLRFQLAALSPTRFIAVEAPVDIQLEFSEPRPEGALTLSVSVDGGKAELYHKLNVTAIDHSQLPDYTGVYYSDELNVTYTLTLEGEQLFLRRGYGPQEPLKPVTRELFSGRNVELQFLRNEQQQVWACTVGADRVRHICFNKAG